MNEDTIMSRNLGNINKYRVDLLDRIPDEEQASLRNNYKAPCGMNTIVRLSDKPLSIKSVVDQVQQRNTDGKVLVFFQWIPACNDYAVSKVVEIIK